MNIAIISPWAISKESVGGTERFIIDLASGLKELGEAVEVFMLSGRSQTISAVKYTSLDFIGNEQTADEYALQRFASNAKSEDFYKIWGGRLENAIDASKFDVIQLNSLLFIDAWLDKPRIFTIHTNPFEYTVDWGQERFEYVMKKIRAASFSNTSLTVPSEHYANYFSKILHRPVLPIPHAIEVSRLAKTASTQSPAKNDVSVGKLTILLPSRLEPIQKRPQIVFKGVALLPRQERERIEILASGTDPHYKQNSRGLKQIANKSGFKARFTVFRSMAEAYSLANIVALPSKSESFGYAALESLALGLPTILNNLPT